MTGSQASGRALRSFGWVALVGLVLLPARSTTASDLGSLAAIYAITALSLNVLVGYAGQLSLGHQGFLGLGALVAANLVTNKGLPLPVAAVGAVLVATLVALLLGVVALRITGLYLSLITLVFGLAIAGSLFQLGSLTNNGSGLPAYRPAMVQGNGAYYLLCLAIVALVLYVDISLTRTKTGRALLALKENERVAEAFGVDVTKFKLIAFAVSGAGAGLAGVLYAFRTQSFSPVPFQGTAGLNLALLFVVMVVVGGLGNRVGVAVAAVFFAVIDKGIEALFTWAPVQSALIHVPLLKTYYADGGNKAAISGLIGAVLLLQTLIFNPGGIGQVVGPLQRWLAGRRFTLNDPSAAAGPLAVEGSSVRA